jgi:hypothetical protein
MIVRFLLLHLLFSSSVLAQNMHERYFSKPRPKIGFGTHNLGNYAEIGLETGFRWYLTNSDGMSGLTFRHILISAGLESNFRFKTDYRLTPKIALEYHGFPITVRVQSRWYPTKNLDFSHASWQICPEIGLNIVGVIFITYGHSFAITNQNHVPPLGNQFMIGINFFTLFDKEI